MNTALIGELVRLRYKLLWAKTRSRNGRIALFLAGLHEPDAVLQAIQLLERSVHVLRPTFSARDVKKGAPVVEHPLEDAVFVSFRSRILLLNLSSLLQ